MRFTGTSNFLPDSVRGIAGTAIIASGTWRGDSSRRSAPAMRAASVVVELDAGRERDEQQELALHVVAAALEVHDEAVVDLGERVDDRVEVARCRAARRPG